MIYADNAATTKLNMKAFEAMKPYLLEEYGNPSQPYSFSKASKNAIKESREIIASCIGASPDEIFFTSGGTESDNWALKGIALKDSSLKYIITSSIEHHAILNAVDYLLSLGHHIDYCHPDKLGHIAPDALRKTLDNNTVDLVSVMYTNNEIGTIQPIKKLCEIAHSRGAIFHTDAVQAVGHININVKDLKVDMLSASSHKFNGPRGVGFLYIRKGTTISPLLHGGAQEYKMRASTENVASIVGMATALRENINNIKRNQQHVKRLENELLYVLDSSNVTYQRNGTDHMPGIVSLSFPNQNGEAILHRLDLKGIMISTGSACDSKKTEISHVLKAIRIDNNLAEGTIRISFGHNNTIDEVHCVATELIRIIE